MIYLDHNATTRTAPEALQEMVDVMERAWANPSSTHGPGQTARRILSDARTRVATALGCLGNELVFTSGATESNHMAVLGAVQLGRAAGRRRLVMSAVEHPGLIALGRRLQDQGVTLDLIPVNARGELDLEAARALIGPDVALLSVMAANNETGVLMPMAELAELARAHQVPFHSDATQWVGKGAVRFADSGADLWSVSAHKLNGPKGVGALIVRKGLNWPALHSGKQERNRRGGTENLPGIAGLAAAGDRMLRSQAEDVRHMAVLRDRLEAGLRRLAPDVHVYAAGVARLPNTLCVRFGVQDADRVLGKLERAGVIASSGAACSAGGTQPSHVLLALGASPTEAKGSIRFSLGRDTTAAEIDETLAVVTRVILPLLQEEGALAA